MRYVCTAVMHGFCAGVAVIIAVSQLPSALGLERFEMKENIVDKLREVATHLPEAQRPT